MCSQRCAVSRIGKGAARCDKTTRQQNAISRIANAKVASAQNAILTDSEVPPALVIDSSPTGECDHHASSHVLLPPVQRCTALRAPDPRGTHRDEAWSSHAAAADITRSQDDCSVECKQRPRTYERPPTSPGGRTRTRDEVQSPSGRRLSRPQSGDNINHRVIHSGMSPPNWPPFTLISSVTRRESTANVSDSAAAPISCPVPAGQIRVESLRRRIGLRSGAAGCVG